ncbi:hypothetical protein ACOME3_006007 [Neoechinorhynchus agilis]
MKLSYKLLMASLILAAQCGIVLNVLTTVIEHDVNSMFVKITGYLMPLLMIIRIAIEVIVLKGRRVVGLGNEQRVELEMVNIPPGNN